MNKTISINLGGSVFNIEEDAFMLLKQYLDSIKMNFSGDPASQEIMSDIESRIAEIFHEKNSDRKNVVVKADVEYMMSVMGQPEDYRMDDEGPKQQTSKENNFSSAQRNPRRKIYRDTDDAVIAGVCSGLSHYFGVDPLIIRLLMVILTVASIGFPGVMGYLLFWALVPPAVSTAEKLQMRGEHVNIENIGKFVNEEARSAAERVSSFGRSASQGFKQHGGQAVNTIGKVFAVIFGIILITIGLGLMAMLVGLVSFSQFNVFGFDGHHIDLLNTLLFANDGTLYLLLIGGILTIASPAIGLLYSGIRLMTGATRRIRGFGVSLLSLFIIGVLMLIYGGVSTGKQFSSDAEINSTYLYTQTSSDTLHLDVIPDDIFIGRSKSHHNFSDLVKIGDQQHYYGEPINVEFTPTTAEQFKVLVKRRANGESMDQAGLIARNIDYSYTASGDSLLLSPWFTTPKTDLYRGQSVFINVYVPIGKYVQFGKNSSLLTWYDDESGAYRMGEDGLEEEQGMAEKRTSVNINSPDIQVTDDSVIIQSGALEIRTKRN